MSAIRWPRTRKALMSSCTRAVLSIALAMSTAMSGAQRIGLVRDAQRGEDVLVEAALADEELVRPSCRNSPDPAPWMTRWS